MAGIGVVKFSRADSHWWQASNNHLDLSLPYFLPVWWKQEKSPYFPGRSKEGSRKWRVGESSTSHLQQQAASSHHVLPDKHDKLGQWYSQQGPRRTPMTKVARCVQGEQLGPENRMWGTQTQDLPGEENEGKHLALLELKSWIDWGIIQKRLLSQNGVNYPKVPRLSFPLPHKQIECSYREIKFHFCTSEMSL